MTAYDEPNNRVPQQSFTYFSQHPLFALGGGAASDINPVDSLPNLNGHSGDGGEPNRRRRAASVSSQQQQRYLKFQHSIQQPFNTQQPFNPRRQRTPCDGGTPKKGGASGPTAASKLSFPSDGAPAGPGFLDPARAAPMPVQLSRPTLSLLLAPPLPPPPPALRPEPPPLPR